MPSLTAPVVAVGDGSLLASMRVVAEGGSWMTSALLSKGKSVANQSSISIRRETEGGHDYPQPAQPSPN